MNIRDVPGLLDRNHRPLIWRRLKIRRDGIADRGIEPVVQRHAGTPRRVLGPLADGWIDAFTPPRYARIHAFVRFRLRRRLRLPPPRASLEKRQSNSAQVVCLWRRLFRVTVKNRLRNGIAGPESSAFCVKSRPEQIGVAMAVTLPQPLPLTAGSV